MNPSDTTPVASTAVVRRRLMKAESQRKRRRSRSDNQITLDRERDNIARAEHRRSLSQDEADEIREADTEAHARRLRLAKSSMSYYERRSSRHSR